MRPALHHEIRIEEADFLRLQRMIEEQAGIFVTSGTLLVQRLARRLRELGLDSFGPYCSRVRDDPVEREDMLERICTHESRFFREPQQFRYLEEVLCTAWHREAEAGKRARSLRVWSAGCANGEEPFSVAMVLRSRLPSWRIEIVASDLSSAALERARSATWPVDQASEIPPVYLERFMLEGTGSQSGRMRAAPELVPLVHTQRINLHGPVLGLDGRFDAILCRNVLIYFREPARVRALDRLCERLAPGGHLFLGHAEGLGTQAPELRSVGPIVYRRDRDPGEAA